MHSFTPNTRIKSEQINENFDDVASGVADTDNNRLQLFRSETCFDFVESGLIWSVVSGLNLSMTTGVAYIANASDIMDRIVVAQITSRAFTASKDTYVDLGADGTIYYSEVNNAATAPSLSANRIRIAIVSAGASSVNEIFQTDQRQANTTLADRGYAGLDNIGNPVRNTSPFEMIFRVTRHNGTAARSSLANGAWTVLPNMSFKYRTGRSKGKIIFEYSTMSINNAGGGNYLQAVFVNSNLMPPLKYTDKPANVAWTTDPNTCFPAFYSANTSLDIELRYQHAAGATYTNNSTDQQYTMPSVTVKVMKAGT